MSSGDVAIPDDLMTLDQRRRVAALQVARGVLAGGPKPFSGSKIDTDRAIWEITALADWIIAGSKPDDSPDTVHVLDGAGNVVASIPTEAPRFRPEDVRPGIADDDAEADAELKAAHSDVDDGV